MPDSPLLPGTRLKQRYLIVRVMTVNGAGALYEARDMDQPGFMHLRAIKEVAQPDLSQFDANHHMLTQLNHRSIPTTYDYFLHEGRVYHVTELIHGRDLESIIGDAYYPLPIEAVHQWAIELTEVLGYLHTHPLGEIVHRDVKPSNVMIDQRLRAQIVDFGIAGIFPDQHTDNPLGTDGYAAPEQYEGDVSPLIDVYGLGSTLHHILTGRDPRLEVPFSQTGHPVRLSNDRVSEAFDALIMRALAYDPHERFPSMQTFGQALSKIDPLA